MSRRLATQLSRAVQGNKSLRSPNAAFVRTFHASQSSLADKPKPEAPVENEQTGGTGFLGALMYGSKTAKAEGLVANSATQHSKLIGRNKYVHQMVTDLVIPSHRDEYVAAADKYYRAIMNRGDELGGMRLTGSWEAIVGSVGTFNHIIEFDGYKAFDTTIRTLREDKDMAKLQKDILPHIVSREHQMMSEFSFWPSSPPRDSGYPGGGIFEMRSYQLVPGKLLEWEGAWRRGLEARRRFVQPVGAFFSQVGQLHEVHHLWQYPDMETRKSTREKAWSVGGWSDTVRETVRLTKSMKSTILLPCDWSPLR
ncbi:hypothetical protein BD324DRAFT_633298 [Kockovaella imperatae]|uniref:NIPSNAP domain-containing protein n=1 Tax=Kockovaella imperatae TaxID=4999 RepID=A0A1Y1UBS9_9TREE|nr:hypothetical protein BD324DRAFT_633298 [Kockovaella imperatae]ORX34936.1 hypothetical protein BD324DRAFT_633298 [Kockovaella imperatae]